MSIIRHLPSSPRPQPGNCQCRLEPAVSHSWQPWSRRLQTMMPHGKSLQATRGNLCSAALLEPVASLLSRPCTCCSGLPIRSDLGQATHWMGPWLGQLPRSAYHPSSRVSGSCLPAGALQCRLPSGQVWGFAAAEEPRPSSPLMSPWGSRRLGQGRGRALCGHSVTSGPAPSSAAVRLALFAVVALFVVILILDLALNPGSCGRRRRRLPSGRVLG